jgi:hypothetical protein
VEASAGEPAVVLEAGTGNGAASWQRVMPLLAPHVRVAAYNRAGNRRQRTLRPALGTSLQRRRAITRTSAPARASGPPV